MTKGSRVYWSLCIVTATTLVVCAERSAGAASGTVGYQAAPPARPQAPAAGELRLSPCAPDIATPPAECGTYTVWENRAARSGRTIDLKIVLLRATGPGRRSDPLVFLAGGPGQAATALTRSLAGSSRRRERDILLVDQRGTGGSNGLFCGPELTAPASAFMASFDPARAQKCARELSSRADLRQYLTPHAMDDLDELRAALGYQTLNLHGESYGTRAALVYLRQHGDHVRSVTLQSALAMSHPMLAGLARAAEDSLEGVIGDCGRDRACANAFPELRMDYQRAVSAIEADGRTYSVRDPRGGSMVPVTLTARDFAESLRGMLYAPASARQVPLFLHQAATTGDYRPFAEFQLQRNIGFAPGFAEGMYFAVTCTEDIARTNTAAAYAAGRGTFLADHRARAHVESCRGWPTGTLPADFGQEVASDVPVLIITGEYDPVAPPSHARSAASRLGRSRVVIVPHGGHSASGLTNAACVQQLMVRFLETADADALDTGCLATMQRPAFVVSQETSSTVAASPQIEGPTSTPSAEPPKRPEITVPEAILEAYVGEYANTPALTVKITLENGSLWGEPTGYAKRQMFAETETKFFLKSSPTELTFHKDDKGKVIGVTVKSGSTPEMTLKKVR
jgi:pimeloyl-ACP methyl ester carboxylesterase